MNLFSPQIEVRTEKYCFSKGVEIEINSCEDTYYDWAKLRFVTPFEQKIVIENKEKVEVSLGYNGDFEAGFTGYATTNFMSGSNSNEIILKDAMLLLEAVTINNTFMQASPQEIIRYCANLAGVEQMQLDPTPYQPKARLPLISQNGIQTIRSLSSIWRIQPKFFFQNDALFWGCAPEQNKVCHFEYAKNIISFDLIDGYWELKTVSVPFVKHSQQILVTHPKASGKFKVHRVLVTTKANGFIRTTLYCKGT